MAKTNELFINVARLLMLWGCFVTGVSEALLKTDGDTNSAKYQDISAQNLVASSRSFKLSNEPQST